jgi:hypothetical protein
MVAAYPVCKPCANLAGTSEGRGKQRDKREKLEMNR